MATSSAYLGIPERRDRAVLGTGVDSVVVTVPDVAGMAPRPPVGATLTHWW